MKLNKLSHKQLLFAIILIAFIIRLGFGIVIFQQTGTSGYCDDWDYISYAKNILDQGIFVRDLSSFQSNSHLVGPVFPMIVALSLIIFGETYLPIIILNVIVSTLICILIYLIGKQVFNSKVGLIASFWSAFYVLFIRYIPRVLKETWVPFLFLFLILMFLCISKQKRISYINPIMGLLFSLLIHMDERFFIYFPVLAICFLIFDKLNWKSGFKKAVIFSFTVILIMIPWLIRNYQVYKKPVIITERTSQFTDKIFGYNDETNESSKAIILPSHLYKAVADSIIVGKVVKSTGSRIKGIKRGISLGYIPHKFNTLERYWAEFKEFWRPVRFTAGYVGDGFRFEGPSWSLVHNLSLGVTYGLLLPFFLIGSFFIIKYKIKYGIFFLILILTHTFLHVVLMWARNRYRIPVDPLIIIIAFYGLYNLKTILPFNRLSLNNKL